LALVIFCAGLSAVQAQSPSGVQDAPTETRLVNDPQHGHASGRWEGSPGGKAFSELNHHFAGFFDIVFGLAELSYARQYPLPLWTRLVLSGAIEVVGGFVLFWSDHAAWPISSLSFREMFSGEDREIVQYKFYGVLALLIVWCETLRRLGRGRHPVWTAPFTRRSPRC